MVEGKDTCEEELQKTLSSCQHTLCVTHAAEKRTATSCIHPLDVRLATTHTLVCRAAHHLQQRGDRERSRQATGLRLADVEGLHSTVLQVTWLGWLREDTAWRSSQSCSPEVGKSIRKQQSTAHPQKQHPCTTGAGLRVTQHAQCCSQHVRCGSGMLLHAAPCRQLYRRRAETHASTMPVIGHTSLCLYHQVMTHAANESLGQHTRLPKQPPPRLTRLITITMQGDITDVHNNMPNKRGREGNIHHARS